MGFAEDVSFFITEYFYNPLAFPDRYAPYNVFNTLAFALIALAAIYAIYKGLQRVGVRVDERFVRALVPFIFFGSFTRVLVDAQALPRGVEVLGFTIFPFVTPYIYVLVFLLVIAAMAFAKWQERRGGEFAGTLEKIGVGLAVLAFLPLALRIQFVLHLAGIVVLGALGLLAFDAVNKWRKSESGWGERLAVFGQAFDGAATFVGVGIGTPATTYAEQHVVGNAIFDAFGGPLAFYVIKVAFAMLVVFLVRRELAKPEEREEKNYVLLLVTIFGLAPGLRDALRIAVGV